MSAEGPATGSAIATEQVLFSCPKDAYVYRVPPASTVGHRAELWNVNEWLQEVAVRVASRDEACAVRLLDDKTGAPPVLPPGAVRGRPAGVHELPLGSATSCSRCGVSGCAQASSLPSAQCPRMRRWLR